MCAQTPVSTLPPDCDRRAYSSWLLDPVIRPTPSVRSEQRGPAPHARALTATHDFTRKLVYCKHPLSVMGTPTVSYSSQQFPCSFLIVLPLFLFHKLQTPTASLLPTWLIIPFFFFFSFRAPCSSRFSSDCVCESPHYILLLSCFLYCLQSAALQRAPACLHTIRSVSYRQSGSDARSKHFW